MFDFAGGGTGGLLESFVHDHRYLCLHSLENY